MENFFAILIPVFLLVLLVRITLIPMRLTYKLFANSACGLVCLWLLNAISGFTGILFPVNPVTAVIVGFLGMPGIGLLAVLQFVL